MNRTLQWIAVALLATTASLPAQHATAQSPDVLRNYRFIPSRSTLEERSILEATGGIAGVQQFLTHGTFGLVTGYDASPPGVSPPASVPHARFVDVNSLLGTTQWLDQKLNMSRLDGTFSPSDPSRLVFNGVDGQNQPFTLIAVQRGRLLRLTGENIHYKFDAWAYEPPYSDFNLDGIVDGADANVLVASMGTPPSILSFELGDADGNGVVDGNDYLTWQREIGDATAMSEFANVPPAGFAAASAAVPEPGTVVFAIMCFVPFFLLRRR